MSGVAPSHVRSVGAAPCVTSEVQCSPLAPARQRARETGGNPRPSEQPFFTIRIRKAIGLIKDSLLGLRLVVVCPRNVKVWKTKLKMLVVRAIRASRRRSCQ